MKDKLLIVSLFSVLLLSYYTAYTTAAPSYIGVSDSGTYYWEASFDQAAYNNWVADGGATNTILDTSEAWTWYSAKGIKYSITSISNEQTFGAPYNGNGAKISYKSYYSEDDLSEGEWIGGGSAYFNVLTAADIDSTNIPYCIYLHRPFFYATDANWMTTMNYLETALLSDPHVSSITPSSSMFGIFFDIDYDFTTSDLSMSMFFDNDGVLTDYIVEYEGSEIISLTLIDDPTEDDDDDDDIFEQISGYEILIILGSLSTIMFYIIITSKHKMQS